MDHPLLAALFDEETAKPVSVSELNADIKKILERSFGSVYVEGEISNFHAAASGHWYFSLTDGDSMLKAACFKGQNFRIRFKPFDGLQVRIRGRITTYEKRGEYQLLVESLEPVGEGALTVAFEQIKAKLAKEGLFAQNLKRPLPPFPRRVGIVTSPTGAAVHDIMTVLERRAKTVSVVIVPTLVQGDRAGEQIARAIGLANEFNLNASSAEQIDVLIVGRGGGSAEDLWAFNEETVARAIRGSVIPVISAVGHEVDFTIADMVADVRAPTPSAAAEIVAASEAEVLRLVEQRSGQLIRSMHMITLSARADLQSMAMAPVFTEFPSRLRERRHQIDGLVMRAEDSVENVIGSLELRLRTASQRLSPIALARKVSENTRRLALLDHRRATLADDLTKARQRKLEVTMAKLNALSPLNVLDRGFALAQMPDGKIIRDPAEVASGDDIRVRLAKGSIEAKVK